MGQGKKLKLIRMLVLVALITLFIIAFQIYKVVEKRPHIQFTEAVDDSIVFIQGELLKDEAEPNYYLYDNETVIKQQLTSMNNIILKPTKLSPSEPRYILHGFNTEYDLSTSMIIYDNDIIEINDVVYQAKDMQFGYLLDEIFSLERLFIFENSNNLDSFIVNRKNDSYVIGRNDWIAILAAVRIAQKEDILLDNGSEILSIAPNETIAQKLIDYGVNSKEGYLGVPILFVPVMFQRVEVARVLIENGADLNETLPIEDYPSLIEIAKLNDDEEMIELLQLSGTVDIHISNKLMQAVQGKVDFFAEPPKEVITQIENGRLPGVHMSLPYTFQEIQENWNEQESFRPGFQINYLTHIFHPNDANHVEDALYESYTYIFLPEERFHINEVDTILGKNFTEDPGLKMYQFSPYILSLMYDDEGMVYELEYNYHSSFY